MKDDIRQRSKSTSSLPAVRLVLVGGARVGKSAITVRFLTKRFIHEYQRNVEHTYRRHMQFGNEIIEYDMKDSASNKENDTLLEWATCIAVIYSITDKTSFTNATSVLEKINIMIIQKNSKTVVPPSLALIANKKDLEHLREISFEEGKKLAKIHGVSFWEVSASEDYHSTHGPLNSLIVESYLNIITQKNTTKNSVSAPTSLKGHEDTTKLRTKSDIMSLSQKRSFETEADGDELSTITTPSEKRRNRSQPGRRSELKLDKERVKKVSVGKLSLDSFPMYDSNASDTSTPDSRNESVTFDQQVRSSSWSRKDKKRSSIKKSNGEKEGIPKSRSYSDLKTWEKEHATNKAPPTKDSRVTKLAKEIDQNGGYKERTGAEADMPTPTALLSPDEKQETSSFSNLTVYSTNDATKSPGPRRERRKTTGLTIPLEEFQDPDTLKSPIDPDKLSKIKRGEKKSVRRKISSIFRPKIVVEMQ